MKPIKLLITGILISMSLTLTSCMPRFFSKKSPHILSSSVKDLEYIPSNLKELDTESLLRSITEVGPNRLAGSKPNAVAGKLIELYFKEIGLAPYKNDSYYYKFNADSSNSSIVSNYTDEVEPYLKGSLENVVGKIKGQDNTKAIVVSAHFDSVVDTTGVIDNASGTTAMLQIAKQLTDRLNGKTFPVDIIFVGFNGEEYGLFGSKEFFKDLSKEYKDIYDINLDCVGAKDVPLALKNNHQKSDQLYKDLIPYIQKYNIDHDVNLDYTEDGTSDHAPFQEGGKAAIAIGEKLSFDILHTTKDTNLGLIDHEELRNLINAISDFIIDGNGKMY